MKAPAKVYFKVDFGGRVGVIVSCVNPE